jgi:ACS family allantoate permease-like MFS transporter
MCGPMGCRTGFHGGCQQFHRSHDLATVSSFRDLRAQKLTSSLLGVLESVVVPAINMFMTQYYKAGEQGTRTGVWMSANSFAPILGASLAYGLYTADMKGDLPMAGWKLVYIILGVATSATGVLFLIFVPDTPAGARWLSPTDRKLAVERVRSGQQGVINHEFRWNQVKEAFRDPFVSLINGQV